MSITNRTVPCAESPMLTESMTIAEQVVEDMNQLHKMPGDVVAGSMQMLNYHLHKAWSASQEMLTSIKPS